MRQHSVIACLLAAALSVAAGCRTNSASTDDAGVLPAGAPKPNIIFIMVDTLRADRLGCYGHPGGLTPVTDRIAAEGVRFERCVAAAPWTLPSIASLFTSYYPSVHKAVSYRVVSDMNEGRRGVMPVLADAEFDTLAEVLHANGYTTAAFVANMFLRAEYGFGQGFAHFDSSFADNTVRGEIVNSALFSWLEEHREQEPLFLYLHYMDVHGPYDAAARFMDPLVAAVESKSNKRRLSLEELQRIRPYMRKAPDNGTDPAQYERLKMYREYWEARYDAGVAEMDHYLGQLVERLRALRIWQSSYVILTSDHGEAFCEHGLWGHGYSQFQTDLHVPLIVRWPDVLPASTNVAGTVGLIDLMPTLLEQLRLPAGANLQGRSLLSTIFGPSLDPPVAVFAEAVKSGPRQLAIIEGDWKLLVRTTNVPGAETLDGPPQFRRHRYLFNLALDPRETESLARAQPQRLKRLESLLDARLETNRSIKPRFVLERVTIDAERVRALESVGYVGGSKP